MTDIDITSLRYKYSYSVPHWRHCADCGETSVMASNKDRYTEKMISFIRNGWIKGIPRHGKLASGQYSYVDNLHITYDGNRISTVLEDADAVTQNGSMDYPGGNKEMAFGYNGWGAMTKDESRGISDITYDRFGNPLRISFSEGGSTENVYSATGEKLKATHTTSASGIVAGKTVTEYHGNVIFKDGKLDMVLFPGGYATQSGGTVTFHYYTQDYLGNNRAVVNGSTGAIEQTIAYYPYGGVIADLGTIATAGQPYKFGGKELITANGLNEYDFGARRYYQAVPHFTSIDPLCEDYKHLSTYLYCGNNPVNAFDPDGRSTWVTDMEDGRYKVVGGDLNDNDQNIYVLQKDKSGLYLKKGKSIGKTATMTSFYDSGDIIGQKGEWAYGAIIDPNDFSGMKFFSNLVSENPSMVVDYALNARNGERYDFKAKNGSDNNYRGMPFGKDKDGTQLYTSARDIGNIGAGYIAATNGLSWWQSRAGFDGYQSIVKGYPAIEGRSSREAQYFGWCLGKATTMPVKQIINFVNSYEKAKGYLLMNTFKSVVRSLLK